MKKILIPSILFLLSITLVQAQEVSTSTPIIQKQEEIKEFIQQKNIQLQAQIDQKRIEVKEQIEAQKSPSSSEIEIIIPERVLKIISNIFDRFEAVLVKFDGIIVRIEARIQKLKDQEINVAKSEVLVFEAKTKLEQAIISISAIRTEINSEITTTNQISKEQIETYVEICKTILKELQASLVEIILSLKVEGDTEEFSLE